MEGMIAFLQEVDTKSSRSYYINQVGYLTNALEDYSYYDTICRAKKAGRGSSLTWTARSLKAGSPPKTVRADRY